MSIRTYGQFGLGCQYSNGFLAAHRAPMSHLAEQKIQSFNAQILWRNPSFAWVQHYASVRTGIQISYSTLGNDDLLGRSVGAGFFGQLSAFKSANWDLSFKSSFGLAYVNKIFHPADLINNNAISTHWNALIELGVEANFQLSPVWEFNAGIALTHLSNASWRMPNLGLNNFMTSFGFRYYVLDSNTSTNPSVMPLPNKRTNWLIAYTIGGKERFPTGGKRYADMAVSAAHQWSFSPQMGLESAVEWVQRNSTKAYLPEFSKRWLDLQQVGVYALWMVNYGRVQSVLGMGVLVRDVYRPDGPFYQKIGLRFNAKKRWVALLQLRAHWGKADYLEWGLGYRW